MRIDPIIPPPSLYNTLTGEPLPDNHTASEAFLGYDHYRNNTPKIDWAETVTKAFNEMDWVEALNKFSATYSFEFGRYDRETAYIMRTGLYIRFANWRLPFTGSMEAQCGTWTWTPDGFEGPQVTLRGMPKPRFGRFEKPRRGVLETMGFEVHEDYPY